MHRDSPPTKKNNESCPFFYFKPFPLNQVYYSVATSVMENKISFKKIRNWLKAGEMFARPSKMLPGKWQLFEYYYDSGADLINIKETELQLNKNTMLIEFNADNILTINENLKIEIFRNFEKGNWFRKRNFVTFINTGKHEENLTFQFDASSEQLKLLKKDAKGKIDFFGFFKRVE